MVNYSSKVHAYGAILDIALELRCHYDTEKHKNAKILPSRTIGVTFIRTLFRRYFTLSHKFDSDLQSLYFQKNSLQIEESSLDYLKTVSKRLLANKKLVILLEGHSDIYEHSGCDTLLSFQRAQFVKKELMGKGVSAQRLYTSGKGCSKLWFNFPDSTDVGWVMNRRVRIELLRY
ncbi:MAG: OmpA family protein [Bacteroidota bacterium]